MKLEGASAQGRPPLCRLEVTLRTHQNSVINNGVDNEAAAAVFKSNGVNFQYVGHLVSWAVKRVSMPSIHWSQLIFKNISKSWSCSSWRMS